MAGAGGGAWKVAYADFVTAMMAFFMVMWLTSQKPEVKEAVASYFRDPMANQTGGADSDGPKRPRTPIRSFVPAQDAAKNPSAMGSGNPEPVAISPSSGRRASEEPTISMVFEANEVTLSPEHIELLKQTAAGMVGKPNRIEIRSHTIRKPLGDDSPFDDHWQICYARCEAVRQELAKLGIEPYRFRLSQAESNEPGKGEPGVDPVIWNSRVDVYLLSEAATPPAGMAPAAKWVTIEKPKEEKKADDAHGGHGKPSGGHH